MKNLLENPFVKKVLVGLGILIAIILIFNFILLPMYVSGSEIHVPNVVGMTEEEAFEALEDADFNPQISDTSFGVSLPPGRIFLQKPEAGKLVKEGRTIYLFISGGEQIISLPLLKGKSVRDARLALERIGLKLGNIEELASTHPKDMVFDQQFAEGTNLKKGQSVGISVSIGKGAGNIIVPDLIGKSLTEAQRILSDSTLIVGKVNYQISSTLLPNTVLDQYPAPGNKLNSGSSVDLFIT
ncbi:MAG: PASTA domain-containing protein, partial [Ignavibacteria bacterium]|nr:PASTA domain-containing protein [Ignavibacteria bacterium]